MRILFVNRLTGGECLGRMPLGILYLSASLKKDGHRVEIVDACDDRTVEGAFTRWRPDAALYSVRTGYHRFYAALNRRLKAAHPEVLSIFGGPHATFYPEMIERDEAIDAVCVGEGERALCDFMKRREDGGDFEKTPNFWVRRGGRVFKNPVRALVMDIDALPPPDRDLLSRYPAARHFPIRSFIASRGCPYDCTYCFNHAYFRIYEGKGQRVRLPSVDALIEEIAEENRRSPFESIQFEDDIFGMSPRWLEEYSQKYPRVIGLPFVCNLRPELITDRIAGLLRDAGCAGAWLGLESGDERVRAELLDRRNSDEVTRTGIARLERRGIAACTENIIGIPRTTLEQDFKTLDLNISCRPTYVNCSIFQPYPRTDLGKIATEEGLFSGNFDELGDFYEETSLRIPHKKELARMQELFAAVVLWPALRPLVPGLVKLPLHGLYRLVNLALKVLLIARVYRVPIKARHARYVVQLLSAPLGPSPISAPAEPVAVDAWCKG